MTDETSQPIEPETQTPPAEVPLAAAPPPAESAPTTAQTTNIDGGVSAETFNIIEKEVNNYFQITAERMSFRRFEASSCPEVSEKMHAENARLFAGTEREMQRMYDVLVRRRIVLIVGSHSTGRFTSALELARRVHTARTRFVATPLDRHVRIDVRGVFGDAELAQSAMIFRDVFEGMNGDMIRFFRDLEAVGCTDMTRLLQDSGGFAIFTTTHAYLRQYAPKLVGHDIHHELGEPAPELLLAALHKRLDLEADRTEEQEWRERLRSRGDELSKYFHSVAAMFRFVESVGTSLRFGRTLDDILRHFRAVGSWIDSDLRDLDAWTFAFALALVHCLPDSHGIAWTEFDWLRRTISRIFDADLETRQIRRPKNDESHGELLSLADDTLLETSRAEVLKQPGTLRDVIRFREQREGGELWEAILSHNRRVLTLLLPAFIDIAEGVGGHEERYRRLVARIIGRIGEIDPGEITLALAARWSRSDETSVRVLVGPLFQAVVGSRDERYRRLCFDVLRELSSSSRANPKKNERGSAGRLLPLIAAYAEVGSYDLDLALEGLRSVSDKHLAPMIADMQRIEILARRVEEDIGAGRSDEGAVQRIVEHLILQDLARRIYADRGGIFLGVQGALVALCVRRDLAEVLAALQPWFHSGPESALLITLMFVNAGGIASRLQQFRVELPQTDHIASVQTSPFVAAIVMSGDASTAVCTFVARAHQRICDSFRRDTELLNHFQDSLVSHLKTWIMDAAPYSELHPPMIEFLVTLAQANMFGLRRSLIEMLRGEELSELPPRDAKLAIDILTRLI